MTTTAMRWMVVLATAAAATPASAQGTSLEALERGFWRCDYAATQGLLDGGDATQCSVLTEAFKARRFGGDFAAMLAWWRVNKASQHLALSAASAQHLTRTTPRP